MKAIPSDFNFQLWSYRESLRTFAFAFTQNDDDAEDLVQDTLLKALRYAKNFKQGTNLKGWLYMILRNTFINNYRRKNLSKRFMNYHVDLTSITSCLGATHNTGVGKCIIDDVFSALDQLQPQYCIPFVKYFEGYKYHEIAEELNIPIGTVKTRIHVARSILKTHLKAYQDEFFNDGLHS
ncbi:RNA polymerase sigma factor [Pedobacter gandavensis]|uniref:RNA polymerase sigma factor n=1 Tax=Pedobacter gandavensis TaxID=2679963 RepID=UPI00247A9546|nr:RNA polymerase sigma factor [Pedobacter gandavensis]WGQ10678.1 RNA polymerase sigma factor [Pedobacter gandavensis]